MRKSVKFIAALLIVIGAAPVAFSNDSTTTTDEAKLKVWSTANGLYRMLYKDSGSQNLQIRFVNDQNQVLFSERVKSTDGFIKPFDLTQLPAGDYTFEVLTNEGVVSESVTIESASLKYGEEVSVFQPEGYKQFTLKLTDKVDVPLELYLLDENGDLVYKDLLEGASKVYDLNQVHSEEVTVLIYTGQDLVKSSTIKL